MYICQSLDVSIDYGPIIRRYNCVYVTLGTCYSVWMTINNIDNQQDATVMVY